MEKEQRITELNAEITSLVAMRANSRTVHLLTIPSNQDTEFVQQLQMINKEVIDFALPKIDAIIASKRKEVSLLKSGIHPWK